MTGLHSICGFLLNAFEGDYFTKKLMFSAGSERYDDEV